MGRVSNREILTWIQKETDTYPLVVVIGGYSTLEYSRKKKLQSKVEPGPDSDVEIISTDRKCQKGIKAVNPGVKKVCDAACQIKSPDDPNVIPFTFSDADVLGHTAVYTNDAPIYCGGKSRADNLNLCVEFDYKRNTWNDIPNMAQKRHLATSVLDVNGDMWVLGGTANSSAADSTEIYNYKPPDSGFGRWRKGFPLPAALRDTGLQSHCSVKINRTHIFLAGGYARNFDVSDS